MTKYGGTSTAKLLTAIDACLAEMETLNAYYWVFGVTAEEIPDHMEAGTHALAQRAEVSRLASLARQRGQALVIPEAQNLIQAYETLGEAFKSSREQWDARYPIRVLCSQRRLKEIVQQIQRDGETALTKTEADKMFDFSHAIPAWSQIPEYTLVFFGNGMRLSSPEFDMFEAMCWAYDEAVNTGEAARTCRQEVQVSLLPADLSAARDAQARHTLLCRQTVINAFLLIEAYLNSVGHVYFVQERQNLSDDERLYLQEKKRNKSTNAEETRFVSTQDKLIHWVKMISPRGATFDKGKRPYQTFLEVKDYRDALVHFSASKLHKAQAVNFDAAKKSVFTVLDLIEHVSGYLAPKPEVPQYPFWFRRPGRDGRFHTSRVFKTEENPQP